MKLARKVALVTGAGQGIGKGIAEAFANEGPDVVINDVNSHGKAEELAIAYAAWDAARSSCMLTLPVATRLKRCLSARGTRWARSISWSTTRESKPLFRFSK